MSAEPTTLAHLLTVLPSDDRAVQIHLPAGPIRPGFFVTQIVHSQCKSIDCTGQKVAWDEVVVQVMDAKIGLPLSSARLRAALAKATQDVPQEARLRFETSLRNTGLERFGIKTLDLGADITVHLHALSPACSMITG